MTKSLSFLRKTTLALGVAILSASAGIAHAGTMKLGMTTWVGYGPLFLARDLGYFKENGLDMDLEIIEDASLYMAAVAAGQLDGNASTIDEIMKYVPRISASRPYTLWTTAMAATAFWRQRQPIP